MYNTLLLGSGKEKGYLLIGAIFALQIKGRLEEINEYIGISVGSLIAVYINLGLAISDIIGESINFDFFNPVSKNDIFTWFLSAGDSGFIKYNKIIEQIDKHMINNYGSSLTFQELYDITGKTLTITVTDRSMINHPKAIYMNHLNYPDYNVTRAVLESCSIPGLIELINKDHIDGVFTDPFPIEIILTNNDKTCLAFLLQDIGPYDDSSMLTKPLEQIYESFSIPIQTIVLQKLEKLQNVDDRKVKVIFLNRYGSNFIPKQLTKDEKVQLIKDGFTQTLEVLNTM